MGRQYIIGDAQIKLSRQAAFPVVRGGEIYLQVLTVEEALRPDQKGRNSFDTMRGTIEVRAELAIADVDPRSYLGRQVHIDRLYNLCYIEQIEE